MGSLGRPLYQSDEMPSEMVLYRRVRLPDFSTIINEEVCKHLLQVAQEDTLQRIYGP